MISARDGVNLSRRSQRPRKQGVPSRPFNRAEIAYPQPHRNFPGRGPGRPVVRPVTLSAAAIFPSASPHFGGTISFHRGDQDTHTPPSPPLSALDWHLGRSVFSGAFVCMRVDGQQRRMWSQVIRAEVSPARPIFGIGSCASGLDFKGQSRRNCTVTVQCPRLHMQRPIKNGRRTGKNGTLTTTIEKFQWLRAS